MTVELIHTPEGKLIVADPYEHYSTPGSKVRMINSEGAAAHSCYVKDGAIGFIGHNQASLNKGYREKGIEEVDVFWPQETLSRDIKASLIQQDGKLGTIWYCMARHIEPVYD